MYYLFQGLLFRSIMNNNQIRFFLCHFIFLIYLKHQFTIIILIFNLHFLCHSSIRQN